MQRLLIATLALGVCACARPAPTCMDGVRNGVEADVDCGGSCPACATGRACALPEDCLSQVCRRHACAEESGAKCARNSDCPGGVCLDGLCAPLCPAPLLACSGTCVDPRFDPKHCGACGKLCLGNERCEAGACEVRCPPGTLACAAVAGGVACVDAQRDLLHCGSCTTVCAPGQTCTLGKCKLDCLPFQVPCLGQCVSTTTDPLHCGGCGLPCDPGELCSNGQCGLACAPPAVGCDGGACVDVRFDPGNCGGCGFSCPPVPNAQRLCLNGICTRTACNPGFEDCNGLPADGCEAVLAVDPMHCGGCGRPCFSGPCANGNCQ